MPRTRQLPRAAAATPVDYFELLPPTLVSAILERCGVEALFLRLRHVQHSWRQMNSAHEVLAARRTLRGSRDNVMPALRLYRSGHNFFVA